MKKLIFILTLLSIGYVSEAQRFTTWKATFTCMAYNNLSPSCVAITPPVVVTINSETGNVIIDGEIFVKYDSKTEVEHVTTRNGIKISRFTAIDFDGDYCTLNVTINRDEENILFLLLGVWYDDLGVYYKLYPTFQTVKYLKRGLIL